MKWGLRQFSSLAKVRRDLRGLRSLSSKNERMLFLEARNLVA